MSHVYLILFSFFCISNVLFSAGKPATNDDKPRPPLKVMTLEASAFEHIQQHLENSEPTVLFSTEEIEEMKVVFETSPQRAQQIVDHLQDPMHLPDDKDFRSVIFVGPPGSGKTTMAKAIAYNMIQKGWEYKFLSSTSVLGEHRNQTAIRLRQELEKIEKSKKPTILIIDELNRLLENADSKHHDTDSNSTALWTFLDKQLTNKNFFLIGTMNRGDKLPQPYKDRVLAEHIKFTLMIDPHIRTKTFRKNLNTQFTQLDAEVTDEFLNKELEKIGPCSGRNLKKIAAIIRKTTRLHEVEKTPIMVVKKTSITNAINEYIQVKIELDYDAQYETDEERQNRHHKENLEAQERHFVMQQKMQLELNIWQSSHMRERADHYKTQFENITPDEQRQIYADMMKNTYARRDQEAADAAEAAAIKKAAETKSAEERAAKWFWDR